MLLSAGQLPVFGLPGVLGYLLLALNAQIFFYFATIGAVFEIIVDVLVREVALQLSPDLCCFLAALLRVAT